MSRSLPLARFAVARLRLRSLGELGRFFNDLQGRRSACVCLPFRDVDCLEVFFVVEVCWSESDFGRLRSSSGEECLTGRGCSGLILHPCRACAPLQQNAF